MGGRFVVVVTPAKIHKCDMPDVSPYTHGEGTVWECECGQKYTLYEYDYLNPVWIEIR